MERFRNARLLDFVGVHGQIGFNIPEHTGPKPKQKPAAKPAPVVETAKDQEDEPKPKEDAVENDKMDSPLPDDLREKASELCKRLGHTQQVLKGLKQAMLSSDLQTLAECSDFLELLAGQRDAAQGELESFVSQITMTPLMEIRERESAQYRGILESQVSRGRRSRADARPRVSVPVSDGASFARSLLMP